MNRDVLLLCGGLATVAAIVAIGLWPADRAAAHRGGPATLDEVTAIARRAGLYHRPDGRAGVGIKLIVSAMPLSVDQAGRLRVNDPHYPGWIGTAAVYSNGRSFAECYDPTFSVYWGDCFVYGDPEIIARLTGTAP